MTKKISKTVAFILVFGMILGVALSACTEAGPGSHEGIEPREAPEPGENRDPIDVDEGGEPDHTEDPVVAPPAPDAPSPEMIAQIKQDKATKHDVNLDMVEILGYYGTYDGSVVVAFGRMSSGPYTQVGVHQAVAGFVFSYPNAHWVLQVWKDGEFYILQQAYDEGLLTQDNISKIHDLHSQNPRGGLWREPLAE